MAVLAAWRTWQRMLHVGADMAAESGSGSGIVATEVLIEVQGRGQTCTQ